MAQEFDFDIGNVVGPPGATGNGIKSIQLLSTSGLVKTYRITFTDDTTFDFSVSDGEDGDDGNGISGASFDAETNELTITFDDGTSFTTPSLKGAPGTPGDDGSSDYTELTNKPKINNVELNGNKTAHDLGLAAQSDIPTVPVQSVNGKTGAVTLSAADVGAKPASYTAPVSSVNGKTGAVNLASGDIAYNESATYQAGTVGAELSNQSRQLSDKAEKTIYQTVTGTTLTLNPAVDNTMYLCGELTELTITPPASGIFAVRFTSGTTPTVVTLNNITMPDDWPTTLDASTTYEINVLNGFVVWQSWI